MDQTIVDMNTGGGHAVLARHYMVRWSDASILPWPISVSTLSPSPATRVKSQHTLLPLSASLDIINGMPPSIRRHAFGRAVMPYRSLFSYTITRRLPRDLTHPVMSPRPTMRTRCKQVCRESLAPAPQFIMPHSFVIIFISRSDIAPISPTVTTNPTLMCISQGQEKQWIDL